MIIDADIYALFADYVADIDSVPFAHDNQWVGDQTPEVPR